jgi:hypothetical protein
MDLRTALHQQAGVGGKDSRTPSLGCVKSLQDPSPNFSVLKGCFFESATLAHCVRGNEYEMLGARVEGEVDHVAALVVQ